jgi:hypothetical protein
MNTKHLVFLAHDPGGCDVTRPVYRKLLASGYDVSYFCIGPAAALQTEHASTEEEFFLQLNTYIASKRMSVLVTGRSWGSDVELRAIRLCQSYGIPTVTLLDYWSNYLMQLADDSKTVVVPDYYVVMDELAKKEAELAGVPASVIHVMGHPGLDRYIQLRGEQRKTRDSTFKVLYLSQPLSLLYGDSWGYTEQSVLRDLINCCEQMAVQLDVKFHPKDDAVYQEQFSDMAVTGDLLELMPQYDLIIGMNSMALLHAVIIGIPAVSYQPGLRKTDGCITTKLGLTPLITDYENLAAYLEEHSRENNSVTAKAVSNPTYLWFDGQSTERVASFVEGVIRNG